MAPDYGMDRRQFLKVVAAGAAAQVAGLAAPRWLRGDSPDGQARGKRPPNILVIMSDEHNASVTGCYGNKLVRTPNLDRLAERGVTFDAAYTNSPLCVPCRLSFTSGKYISRVGAWSNSCWLPSEDYPSLPRVMNAAGYESVLCGKMHYDLTRRYGFTEIGNHNRHFKTGGGGRMAPDTPSKGKLSSRFDSAKAGDDSGTLRHDRDVTAHAVEFLEARKPADKPFFLFVGYLAPHFPLTVPQKYLDNYKGKVPMPRIPPGHLEGQPLNYQMLRRGFQVDSVPDEVVRNARECYYGLEQWSDEEIGKVLQALEEGGQADNTVVIYTTDHGENMGEHGLWWKNDMYEHAARVPLIVSWPARWKGGQRRSGACSLVDVVKTVAELGGAKTPGDWNGDSLCACLDDPSAPWKDLAVSEYYAHNIASGFVMLRSGQYKYVYHTPADETHPAQRQLFDLKADPGEFHNLASEAGQQDRIRQMHAALVKELGEDPDLTEKRCRADYAKGYGREKPATQPAEAD